MSEWWFTRTYEDRTDTEDQEQTRYESDADTHRKGE